MHSKFKFKSFFLLLFVFQFTFSLNAFAQNEPKTLQGELNVIYSDKFDSNTGKFEKDSKDDYILNTGKKYFHLNLNDFKNLEYLDNLIGKNVEIVTGNDYKDEKNLINVLQIKPLAKSDNSQNAFASDTNKPWLNILCKFSDISSEPVDTTTAQNMFRNTFPFIEHYWKQTTFGRIDISGTQTVGWFTLSHPRSYYVNGSDVNLSELATDCRTLAGSSFDPNKYTGTNLYFNGDLGGPARGGYFGGIRTTWLPPWSHTYISVVTHEMGHTYGLLHSSGMYASEYDSPWDVMSNTYTNAGSISPYKYIPQHTIAFHKYKLGAIESKYIWSNLSYDSTNGVIVNLNRLETEPSGQNSFLMLDLYSVGGEHYTVETRDLIDYDEGIPASAVIIHKIEDNRRAYVIDPDGNLNPGDASAQWTPGETYKNSDGDIKIEIIKKTTTGFDVKITAPRTIPVPIYRLYNTRTGAQLYTRGEVDKNKILNKFRDFEFTDGAPAFYASLTDDGNTPIYRLYNKRTGAQLYTRGEYDRDKILSQFRDFEFTDGAPAFYASLTDDGNTPIYRLYNKRTGAQLYTRGEADKNKILAKFSDFEFTDGAPVFYAKITKF